MVSLGCCTSAALPHRRRRLLVCQTYQPLFGTSFRTCHSPWATLQARPAPRLRSWSEAGSAASVLEPAPGPHQARTLAWNL